MSLVTDSSLMLTWVDSEKTAPAIGPQNGSNET
jgi:hypothetical protein